MDRNTFSQFILTGRSGLAGRRWPPCPWTSRLSNTGSECEKDRILFFNREINNLKQLSYEVDENLLISDHRPVFGDFNLNVSHIPGMREPPDISKPKFRPRRKKSQTAKLLLH